MKIISSLAGVLVVLHLSAVNVQSEERKEGTPSRNLNYAQVEHVKAIQSSDGSWCISATVRHRDEGFAHYANAWQVLDESGNEVAWRLLAHPHDKEQPFTREKCDIEIPKEIKRIRVRAKCKVHGFGGQEVLVDLSLDEGEGFKVVRSDDM